MSTYFTKKKKKKQGTKKKQQKKQLKESRFGSYEEGMLANGNWFSSKTGFSIPEVFSMSNRDDKSVSIYVVATCKYGQRRILNLAHLMKDITELLKVFLFFRCGASRHTVSTRT